MSGHLEYHWRRENFVNDWQQSLFRTGIIVINSGVTPSLLLMRPDVNRALHVLTAAYRDVAVARAMYYPALNITPYIGFQGFRIPAFLNAQSIAGGIAGNVAAPFLTEKKYVVITASARHRQG